MSASAHTSKQFFTVQEANQRLPLVSVIVDDIVRLFRDVHERRERLVRIRKLHGSGKRGEGDLYSEEVDQMEREIDRDIEKLDSFVVELRQLGVELKDPVAGLIDFPTKVDGHEAYLCWRLGELEVMFWHDLDSGFKGRQPLLEASVSLNEAER